MKPPKIMIAGKCGELHARVKRLLQDGSIKTVTVEEYRQARKLVVQSQPHLAVCLDTAHSMKATVNMLSAIRKIDPYLPLVLITNRSSEALAITALRNGVNDYLKVPFSDRELISSCQRWIPLPLCGGTAVAGANLSRQSTERSMVGRSTTMNEIKAYIERVARTDSTVLITRETGTGKELAAELIHRQSHRGAYPLVRINCAATPEGLVESELFGYEQGAFTGAVSTRSGKFEMASGGSLFLDEIGEMTPCTQSKILRCIESKRVYPLGGKGAIPLDIRIIAATNQNPEDLISEGKFREDLYYRLNVARLHLPALRDRREDIAELVAFGIRKMNRKFHRNVRNLKEDVLRLLLRYDWPGNVRELMNVLEGAYINMPDRRIEFADLPVYFRNKLSESEHLPSNERRRILTTLLETNWNKSTAAAKLKWSRMTLYRKMTKYHIVQNRQPIRKSTSNP